MMQVDFVLYKIVIFSIMLWNIQIFYEIVETANCILLWVTLSSKHFQLYIIYLIYKLLHYLNGASRFCWLCLMCLRCSLIDKVCDSKTIKLNIALPSFNFVVASITVSVSGMVICIWHSSAIFYLHTLGGEIRPSTLLRNYWGVGANENFSAEINDILFLNFLGNSDLFGVNFHQKN